jgi:hypothetical protein
MEAKMDVSVICILYEYCYLLYQRRNIFWSIALKKLISIIGGMESMHGAFDDSPLNEASGTMVTEWMVPKEFILCHAGSHGQWVFGMIRP